MVSPQTAPRLAAYTAKLPPCCLRVHPLFSHLILLGTYDLQKESGERLGSIEVLEYQGDEVTLLHSIPTPSAILDLKFNPFESTQFITCHSTGALCVWQIALCGAVTPVHTAQLFDPSLLVTSVFFSPIVRGRLCVTLTSGEVAVVTLTPTGLTEQTLATSHDLEAWTCNFGGSSGLENVVFSGGDDSKLIAHDLRSAQSVFQTRRVHDAGIVSILPSSPGTCGRDSWSATDPYRLWTGSYDDHVKSLDLRVLPPMELLLPPMVKQSEALGGGVWRLIPSPVEGDERVLTCCMYDGARILKDTLSPKVYFKGDHESMCYGGDWAADGRFAATCSFYDNVVQIWDPSLEISDESA